MSVLRREPDKRRSTLYVAKVPSTEVVGPTAEVGTDDTSVRGGWRQLACRHVEPLCWRATRGLPALPLYGGSRLPGGHPNPNTVFEWSITDAWTWVISVGVSRLSEAFTLHAGKHNHHGSSGPAASAPVVVPRQ